LSKRVSQCGPLTKVHVDLPNHGGIAGEWLWAVPLGRELFRLQNIPFGAYGLNFGDVVRATRDRPKGPPEIRFVVSRSGHRTLRVYFDDSVDAARARGLLRSLKPLGVGFEGGPPGLYALNVRPEGELETLEDRLDHWSDEGLLFYETCEERRPGSFDDVPEGATD